MNSVTTVVLCFCVSLVQAKYGAGRADIGAAILSGIDAGGEVGGGLLAGQTMNLVMSNLYPTYNAGTEDKPGWSRNTKAEYVALDEFMVGDGYVMDAVPIIPPDGSETYVIVPESAANSDISYRFKLYKPGKTTSASEPTDPATWTSTFCILYSCGDNDFVKIIAGGDGCDPLTVKDGAAGDDTWEITEEDYEKLSTKMVCDQGTCMTCIPTQNYYVKTLTCAMVPDGDIPSVSSVLLETEAPTPSAQHAGWRMKKMKKPSSDTAPGTPAKSEKSPNHDASSLEPM